MAFIQDLFGNTLFVDAVNGDDATAIRGNQAHPYLTVEAALAASVSGDLVYVLPGTYSPASVLTIPAGVALRGASTGVVTIQKLAVVADTTFITMGENCRIEDVAIKLTSAADVNLTGIDWAGTTSATSKLRTATVTVDASAAPGAVTKAVDAMHVHSTGAASRAVDAVRDCTITSKANGTMNCRGILQDGVAGNFSMRSTNVEATRSGGAGGFYVGVHMNNAGAFFHWQNGYAKGTIHDVRQDLGTLELGTVELDTANAGGKPFTSVGPANDPGTVWGFDGVAPSGTKYLRPGTAGLSATEKGIRVGKKTLYKSLAVVAATGPGAGKNAVINLRKNGVTILTVTLSGTATTAVNTTVSASAVAGDILSVQIVNDPGTTLTDFHVTYEAY